MQVMLAVFLTPEGRSAILPNVEGDVNDENLGNALARMYGDLLFAHLDGQPDCDEVQFDLTDDIFVHTLASTRSRAEGKMFAGYMGFDRDYCREDSEHFVFYFDTEEEV